MGQSLTDFDADAMLAYGCTDASSDNRGAIFPQIFIALILSDNRNLKQLRVRRFLLAFQFF